MAYGKPVSIDFDKIYESNSCGKFKIIQDLGRDKRSRYWVRIKFLETGTEKDVRYDIAMDGRVRDDLYGIEFNKIYNSIYYGPYQIIAYLGRDQESKKVVRIRFLNTGYEYDVLHKMVKTGQVKDYSVDYHNRSMTIDKDEYNNHIVKILKSRWKTMMERCYNPNSSSYQAYGAIGVTVCDIWHHFEVFLASITSVKNYHRFYADPTNYNLDKDFYQLDKPKEQRIYSPNTCIFLSAVDNSNLSVMEHHEGYYGIRQVKSGNYTIIFSTGNDRRSFGTYSNLIAALNDYNYYYLKYGNYELVPLLNRGIPYMCHAEAMQYIVKR